MTGRPTASPSLLVRLLVGAGLALMLALAIVGVAIDRAFQGAAESAMKERLEAVVYLILTTVEVDAQGRPTVPESLAEPRLNQPGSTLHGGAMTPFGSWESPSLVGVVEPPKARVIERNTELFRGLETEGTWNVFAVGLGWEQSGGELVDLTIWAAEDPNRLNMTLAGFRADLWRWLGLAAALIIAAQVLILLLLLRPLRRVAAEVGEIEAGRRDRLGSRYPRELQPLTANLNALLDAERDNAKRYREALADLAHSLKTPVAVFRALIDSSDEPDPQTLACSLEDMEHIIRRQLERAAHSTRRALPPAVAVAPVLTRLAESLERLNSGQGLVVTVDGNEHLAARIDERDLWEICGNLMENAAKYGNGQVRASVRPGEAGPRRDGVILAVEDNGPGIGAREFEALTERGRRGDERREGQGLGLAIVRELVEAYGGRLELAESTLGGASIRVILPPR